MQKCTLGWKISVLSAAIMMRSRGVTSFDGIVSSSTLGQLKVCKLTTGKKLKGVYVCEALS